MPSEDLRRTWFLAAGAAALLLLTWLYWPAGGTEGEPADVVRDYLEAVRDGDADRAVAIAGADRPEGEVGRFLTAPGPHAPEWEVTAVSETYRFDYDEDDQEASVAVTIATPDGTAAQGTFSLGKDGPDRPWRIEEPFVEVTLGPSPLWYTEVDGTVAPYVHGQAYRFFPGAHHFYATSPATASVASTPTLLLPGANALIRPPAPALTPAGEQAVQSAVEAYIDDCAAYAALAVPGCPFGADYIEDGDDALTYASGITWTVEEYPVVTAAPDQSGALRLSDRRHGTATVTGRGETTLSMTCPIDTGRLEAGLLPDGGVRIVPAGYRFQLDEITPDFWETC